MVRKNIEKLKIALIGGGVNSSIGPTHIAALNSSQDWEITCGIFGKNKKLLPSLLDKSSTKIYNSIQSLLKAEKNKLNAFLLLTPPQENKKIIELIKKTKIPIISEKPVFNDLKKLKNMKNYFNKNNIKFLSTYNYSYFPALQELKYLVSTEKSKLNKIIIEIPQQGFFLKNAKIKKWRITDRNIPNLFLDLGSHLYNLTFFLTDCYPQRLICKTSSKKNTITDANIWSQFKENFEGIYWISKNAGGHENSLKIEILFEEKTFLWELKKPDVINCNDNNGRKLLINRSNSSTKYFNNIKYNIYKAGHPTGFFETFVNLYKDFFKKIKNKKYKIKESDFNFDHCYKIIKVLSAMKISSKKHRWIETNVK